MANGEIERIKKRIYERLKTIGKTPSQASIEAGHDRNYLSELGRKKHNLKALNVSPLAGVLETSVDFILLKTDDPSPGIPSEMRRAVPILDYASASAFAEAQPEHAAAWRAQATVIPDASVSERAFALVLSDARMAAPEGREPSFRVGDLIIVDPTVAPNPGEFVIARLHEDNETLFAQYHLRRERESGQKFVELAPLNPAFPTIVMDWRHPGQIIGTMIEHRRYWRK